MYLVIIQVKLEILFLSPLPSTFRINPFHCRPQFLAMTTPQEDSNSVASPAYSEESTMLTTNVLMKEEDLRSLFLVLQQQMDIEALRHLYDMLESEFPDELETAQEILEAKQEEERNKENNIVVSSETTKGCYLHYDSSSGKLKLQYSDTPIENALGFYSSRCIPGHKFRKNFGRADLIGGCFSGVQGRKNYYSGWCQFIRAARTDIKNEEKVFGEIKGELWIYPRAEADVGLDVDIYVYDTMAEYQTIQLPINKALKSDILDVDAITCLPKHSDIFVEVKQMELNSWLVRANNVGATTRFTLTASPMDDMDTRRAPVRLVDPSPVKVISTNDDSSPVPEPPHAKHDGCYLLYDPNSCKLKLKYSKTPVRHAIGFYCAGEGHSIRGFKYTKNFGRADLIGNCASGVSGRKNYYSGWCQFIRAARLLNGPMWIYPRDENSAGLDVDIYVYFKDPELQKGSGGEQSRKLEPDEELNISEIDAVACLPKHADFFSEIKTMDLPWWLTEANKIGSTSKFE